MPADISIFSVPYDSGHSRRRMGKGPEALLAAGLENRLAARGHTVRVSTIESAGVPGASLIVKHLRHRASRLGGLFCAELPALFEECRSHFDIAGATVSAFDPDAGCLGKGADIGIELIHSLLT